MAIPSKEEQKRNYEGVFGKKQNNEPAQKDLAGVPASLSRRYKPTSSSPQTKVPALEGIAERAQTGVGIKEGRTSGFTAETPTPLDPNKKEEPVVPTTPTDFTYEEEFKADPFLDPMLIPPATFNSPAYDYWNTAEPATPEEKKTFESKPFQQGVLTFGLSLLLGNSVEDSMMTGFQAYAQSDYVNTDEFAELVNDGVPEQVVRHAFTSGDWSQVKSYQKDIAQQKQFDRQMEQANQQFALRMQQGDTQFAQGLQMKVAQLNQQRLSHLETLAMKDRHFGMQYMAEAEKAMKEAQKVAPNDYQKKILSSNLTNFEKIRTEVQQTNKQLQYAEKVQKDLDAGKTIDNNELIALLNSAQVVYDPKGTVKEGDVSLMMSGLGLPSQFATYIEKAFSTGVVEPNEEFIRSLTNSMIGKGQESLNSLYSNIAGLSRSSTMAGIAEQYQPWRHDLTLQSNPRLDSLYSKYIGG